MPRLPGLSIVFVMTAAAGGVAHLSARLTAAAPTAAVASARGLQMVTFTLDEGTLYVRLPDDMAAGDTIGGSFFHEPAGKTDADKTKNAGVLASLLLILDDRTRVPVTQPFTWTAPSFNGDDSRSFEITLANPRGSAIVKTKIAVHPAVLPPPAGQTRPVTFTLPKVGQHGGRMEISGPFDGRLDTTTVRMGEMAVDVAAESPRKSVFFGPTSFTGVTTLTLIEQTTTVRVEYRHVKVSLAAPKTSLQRGEQTTLTTTLEGLADLREEIPLYLEKFGVVRMDGGDSQTVWIAPADVNGGTYTTTRNITGLERGSFIVNATVIYEPFDITVVDQTTAQVIEIHTLTGDYSVCIAGVRTTGRGTVRVDGRKIELVDEKSPRRPRLTAEPADRNAAGSLRFANPNQNVSLKDQDSRNNPRCQ